jgi:TPR repeat protein
VLPCVSNSIDRLLGAWVLLRGADQAVITAEAIPRCLCFLIRLMIERTRSRGPDIGTPAMKVNAMKLRTQVLVPLILLVLAIGSARAQSVAEAEAHFRRGDYAAALPGFHAGAARGDAKAQSYLGFMYALGKGVPKDDQLAVRWLLSAANLGNAVAQANLAMMYAEGRVVPKDDREAVRLLMAAASQGSTAAQFFLAQSFANGQLGIDRDYREAAHWYRAAAEQGSWMAQFNLALMYAKGEGLLKDDQTAYFWLLLASVQGNQAAIASRDLIEQRLTPNERARAQAAAREWKPATAQPR